LRHPWSETALGKSQGIKEATGSAEKVQLLLLEVKGIMVGVNRTTFP